MSKCPECGQELSSTAQCCSNCGFRLNGSRPNKQTLRKAYIEIGISVFLIIIAILFLFFSLSMLRYLILSLNTFLST